MLVLLLTTAAAATVALVVPVRPDDCHGSGDCSAAIAAAVARCPAQGGCQVVLAPGRYRVECPKYEGLFPYIATPGAVDLGNTSGVTFGAAALGAPAFLDVDYIGNGCPAVSARHAANVTVRNLVIDCQRLPFTFGTIVAPATGRWDGSVVAMKMGEPDRLEFNVSKYPWLADWWTFTEIDSFNASSWNPTTAVATLTFPSSSTRRAGLKPGTSFMNHHYENMPAWGVYGWAVKGGFTLSGVTLLAAAGMGLRCDFCEGTVLIEDSAVRPGEGRKLSTTADGIHFMHHKGAVVLRNTTVAGTGDDCFNVHSNFFIMSNYSTDRRTATYIDETGPGWIPGAPNHMVGDTVAFYSRLTLQKIGPANVLVNAIAGFGPSTVLEFRDAIPAGVLAYDMMLSLDRIAALDAENCTFIPGGRGMVVSATPVRIVNNTFLDLHAASILFLEGGCGAYEDYTEGPFSANILISHNRFRSSSITMKSPTQGAAVIQFGGCRPVGKCAASPPPPPPGTYGPAVTGTPYSIPPRYASITRVVEVALPAGGGTISLLEFWDACSSQAGSDSPPLAGIEMGVYQSAGNRSRPTHRIAWVSWSGQPPCTVPGWRSAAVTPAVKLPAASISVWIAQSYVSGEWNTFAAVGEHFFAPGAGVPVDFSTSVQWKTFSANGIPLRVGWEACNGHASAAVLAPPSLNPLASGYAWPLPPCDTNGSTVPTIITHASDNGPGRITESGLPLDDGHTIYKNVTMINNVIVIPQGSDNFVDVGATDGIEIAGNTFLSTGDRSAADVSIYSSTGFDAKMIAAANRCGETSGASGPPRGCKVTVDDTVVAYAGIVAASLVTVDQFGMSQCAMTTTWTTNFFHQCLELGTGIATVANFTLNIVAGLEGGPVNSTTDAESFHGPQEVAADTYQLCARAIESEFGVGSYQWVNFTACMNGADGIAIVALSTMEEITLLAHKCASEHGFDWRTLSACATGARGASLFNNSAWYTSDEMAAKRIPPYGVFGINNATGFGIPIVRINGRVHKGPTAYELERLGQLICAAAGAAAPDNCGCTPPQK